MSKPIVKYTDLQGDPGTWGKAFLVPVDHPQAHLNGKIVLTSGVEKFEKSTGRIETRNTIYMPQ
jgi:hypothetical protein